MAEDDEIAKLEEELKKLDDLTSSSTTPTSPFKDNVFKFFREILGSKDSRKTGNLKESELGLTRLGVRHYLNLANYADKEGLDQVADYLNNKAEVTSSTSMSRNGFLAQLFVTQIKKEQKLEKKPEKKKKWFTKGEEDE